MLPFDPESELTTLRDLFSFVDHLIAEHEDALGSTAPLISGWSAEHHLAHLALANELCLKNLASLAQGSGMLVVRGGEPLPGAREMLALGRISRGEARSPRMVRPPATIERALLLEWQAWNRRALEALLAAPATLRASELKIPHQLLGWLDAPEWARFAAVHTRHHLVIACEVITAVEPGRALPGLPDLA